MLLFLDNHPVFYWLLIKQVWKGLLFLLLVMIVLFIHVFRFLPLTTERFKKTESVLTEQEQSSPENMETNSERLDVWKADN